MGGSKSKKKKLDPNKLVSTSTGESMSVWLNRMHSIYYDVLTGTDKPATTAKTDEPNEAATKKEEQKQ